MKFTRIKNILVLSAAFLALTFTAAFSQPEKSADKVDNALKILEKIENQVNSRSLDLNAKKQFIEMLELEIERENFFIEELKERSKCFEQYFSILEILKNKTEELKNKLEGTAVKPSGETRINSDVKQITADQIFDVAAYVNFSESKKALEEIEKEFDQKKITDANKKILIKKLSEQLVQINKMSEETRENKRKVEKSIIKMLEVKLRSKNLLDKFYKNLK
ncbi:MAG TPA: hypothetical protein PK467_11175 [Candidatus Wallbacteria bacterium]|nr:hypothetical protein [Candidatus Wallbacteria bacterium]